LKQKNLNGDLSLPEKLSVYGPDVLVIVLKRFAFDMQSIRKNGINTLVNIFLLHKMPKVAKASTREAKMDGDG